MAGIFEALGDPVRRQILELLAGGELAAGSVVASLQAGRTISQPAVSQHLRVLHDAGLVTARPEGTRRLYSVNPPGVKAAQTWLERIVDPLAAFAQPLDALATEVARGRRARRRRTGEQDAARPATAG